MFRGILLAYISLSLFLSQANLPLFTHICHGMGKTWTALVKPPKACCGKIKQKDLTRPCEKMAPNSVASYDKEPCCEDHVKNISLSVQFLSQAVKALAQTDLSPSIPPSFLYGISVCILPSFHEIVQDHGPPNHPSGRDLLIAHHLLLC